MIEEQDHLSEDDKIMQKIAEETRIEEEKAAIEQHYDIYDDNISIEERQRLAIKRFEDWVYVTRADYYLNIKTGHTSKSGNQLNQMIQGIHYISTQRNTNKHSYKKASEAVVEATYGIIKIVNYVVLDSRMEHGEILHDIDRYSFMNVYSPRAIPPIKLSAYRRDLHVKPFLEALRSQFKYVEDMHTFLQLMRWDLLYAGNPTKRRHSIVYLTGCEGSGKTFMLNVMKELIGSNYATTPRGKDINSEFNGYLENKVICIYEELPVSSKSDFYSGLKQNVTGQNLTIRKMRTDTFEIPNTVNFYVTSNDIDALKQRQGNTRGLNFMPRFLDGETKELEEYFVERGIVKDDLWGHLYACMDNENRKMKFLTSIKAYLLNEVPEKSFAGRGNSVHLKGSSELIDAQLSESELFIKNILVDCPAINKKMADNLIFSEGLEKIDQSQFRELIKDRVEVYIRPWKEGKRDRSSNTRVYVSKSVEKEWKTPKNVENRLRDWQETHGLWKILD